MSFELGRSVRSSEIQDIRERLKRRMEGKAMIPTELIPSCQQSATPQTCQGTQARMRMSLVPTSVPPEVTRRRSKTF